MRQAVAGITANRDGMSSSEYQHSSSTTTSGNLEEVFLESPSSVLSHLSFLRSLRDSKPHFSGRDTPSLFSLTAFGSPASRPDLLRILQPIPSTSSSNCGQKAKASTHPEACTYLQTYRSRHLIRSPSPETSPACLPACLNKHLAAVLHRTEPNHTH